MLPFLMEQLTVWYVYTGQTQIFAVYLLSIHLYRVSRMTRCFSGISRRVLLCLHLVTQRGLHNPLPLQAVHLWKWSGVVSYSIVSFGSFSFSPTCLCLLEHKVGLCQRCTQLSEEWWNYISGPGKWRDGEVERQSGKEGASILCPSRAKGNFIRPIMEPFFTSFHISLLHNCSSCPFLPPLYSEEHHLAFAPYLEYHSHFSELCLSLKFALYPISLLFRKKSALETCVMNPVEQ